jgi:hypothetical protein
VFVEYNFGGRQLGGDAFGFGFRREQFGQRSGTELRFRLGIGRERIADQRERQRHGG